MKQGEGWNLTLALSVTGVLTLMVILMIAMTVRMSDAFDTMTELLIGAVFLVGFLGFNGAVIYYLHSMQAPARDPADQKPGAKAQDKTQDKKHDSAGAYDAAEESNG